MRLCDILASALLQTHDPATAGIGLAAGTIDGCPCPMNQQRPEVPVASLTNPQEALFAATGTLPGYEAQPRGQMPSVGKLPGVADRGHQRRGDHRPDAFHAVELLALSILGIDPLHHTVRPGNPLIERDKLLI